MEVKVLRWSLPVAPNEAELRQELAREGYEVFKWADSGGTAYSLHEHPYHASLWVLEGKIECEVGENRYLLEAGDRLFIPAGTRHASAVPGPESCFYLVGQKE